MTQKKGEQSGEKHGERRSSAQGNAGKAGGGLKGQSRRMWVVVDIIRRAAKAQ